MRQRQRCVVRYQVATYSGEEIVYCNANDETEHIVAKAKKQLKSKSGEFPFGYQSFKVIEREDYFGE